MPEYTASIEAQIDEALRLRGSVGVDDIPGIDAVTGEGFLRHYAHAREHDPELIFDGATLTRRAVSPAASPAGPDSLPGPAVGAPEPAGSHLERVVAGPQYPAVLDSAPSARPVSPWMWLLPLALGLVGGIVAFMLAKGEDSRAARNLLIAGVAVSVLTACVPFLCVFAGLPFGSGTVSDDPWPASASGAPVFYYFGTSG